MLITDFDYDLPLELIAQYPEEKRDEARLLVVDRQKDAVYHRKFYDILDYLQPGDCLVMNDSRVLPARLFGRKRDTGAKAEFLLVKRKNGDRWEAMVKPGKKLKPGSTVDFCTDEGRRFSADILDFSEDGTRIVEFSYDGDFHDRLEENGHIPLPPYIDREDEALDREMYQTVYSREDGSVASPTAGLHFTEELLQRVREKGIRTAYVTLHVGIGTFRPVKCDVVEDHHMHFEEYSVTQENADMINETKRAGGRVISVGTTSSRTLESASLEDGTVLAGSGSTDIFIYPGYKFKVMDGLITNFHLPESTLVMLVSAFAGRGHVLKAYEEAVKEKYRFFSFGDAMFIADLNKEGVRAE